MSRNTIDRAASLARVNPKEVSSIQIDRDENGLPIVNVFTPKQTYFSVDISFATMVELDKLGIARSPKLPAKKNIDILL